ncbi:MAG: acetyl-CoA carboxylase carboxyltransferase subunit alpha [Acidobacteriota bacterium]
MKENKNRSAFDRVQLARHPDRPYTTDLLSAIFTDFVELHGDRRYSDDAAIVSGFAKLDEWEVAVIGQQKGRDINQRRFRNFGMPKPEGYRKALRVMKMAEKFGRPLLTFIDTPGAYPGIDAEERGQAEAIAFNLREMANLKIPTIVVILGEGGSGGALAIGIGDRVLMLENAVYSVITPEGCAAILWKDNNQAGRAAEVLGLTAENLVKFGLIDEIISEPDDWKISPDENSAEHAEILVSYSKTTENLKKILRRNLMELNDLDVNKLLDLRYKKFRKMGSWLA